MSEGVVIVVTVMIFLLKLKLFWQFIRLFEFSLFETDHSKSAIKLFIQPLRFVVVYHCHKIVSS